MSWFYKKPSDECLSLNGNKLSFAVKAEGRTLGPRKFSVITDEDKRTRGSPGGTEHGHGGSEQWNCKQAFKYCFTSSLPTYGNVYYNTNTTASVLFVKGSVSSYSPPPFTQIQKWTSLSSFFIVF